MAAQLPVTIRIKAETDPNIGKALKSLKDFVGGLETDALRAAKAFEALGSTARASANNVGDVTGGAQKATTETSRLGKGLLDLRTQAGRSGAAFTKAGEDLSRAFAQADRAPTELGESLRALRAPLREVGNTAATEFRRMKTEATSTSQELKQLGDSFSPQELLGRLAQSAAIASTVKAAFTTAARSSIEFEAELRSLNTITGMTEQGLTQYGESLRTLSLELKTTTGAAENARAAYDVASAGFTDAAANAAVLEATLKAATAGNVEAAEAARLISGTLRAYGADAQEAEKYTNVFFATVKNGITTFPELASHLGQVTGVAAQAGISVEELGAAVATATARGQRTSTAVDGLRGAIANLLAPSKEARDEMERLGIVVNEQTLKQDGLLKTLQNIAAANGGSAASFKALLGDVQAFGVALSLTSDGGELFAKNLQEMQTNVTALSDAVAEKAKTLEASIGQFKVALEAASGEIGETFIPAGKVMVDTATAIVAGFAKLPEPIRTFATVLGTAAIAIGATVKVTKLLATATQLETIQLALSTAARTLNTTVTAANTRATLANTAALVRTNLTLAATTVQARLAALSLTGLQTATLGVAASLGPLLLAGGAVILWALQVRDAMKEAEEALDDYVDAAGEASAKIDDAFKSTKKSAQELLSEGKTSSDLLNEMAALRQAAENIKEEYNKGNLTLEARDRQLQKIANSIQDLRAKSAELRNEEKKGADERKRASEAAALAPSLGSEKKAEREKEAMRKEALAKELSRIDVLKNRRELSAQQEIKALENVLKAYELKTEERLRIEERVAKLIGDQKAKAEKAAEKSTKKRLESSLRQGTSIPVDTLKNQKGTQEAVAAYDLAISRVEEWQRKNKALIDQFPELGQKAATALEKLRADRAAAETSRLSTNFKNLQQEFKSLETGATTLAQKLGVVDQEISRVRQEQRSGSISLQDAERELARLGERRLSIEERITQQKYKQAGELNDLEAQAIQQEIEMLELRKEEGFNVDNQLMLKREELYQFRLKRLELEYQAEREAAEDKLHVDRKYQLERQNLERAHTLEVSKELKKRLDDARTNQVDLSNASRPSGPTSSGKGTPATRDRPEKPAPGEFSNSPSYFSVDASPFHFQTDEEREAKRQQATEDAEKRRRLFETLNPQAVLKVQQIDRERALQRAKQEVFQGYDRIDPGQLVGTKDGSRIRPPVAPPDPRTADPSGLVKKVEAEGTALEKKAGTNPAAAPPQVTNQITNNLSLYIKEKSTKRTVSSADEALRMIKREIEVAQIYDPNAGLS